MPISKYVTTSYSYPIYASLAVNAAMAASQANRAWWEETLVKGIEFRKKLLRQSKLFKPLVPTKINGISWENIPTEKLATDLSYGNLILKIRGMGLTKVALGEAIISPLKLTITSPGVDLKTGKYTETGIVSP